MLLLVCVIAVIVNVSALRRPAFGTNRVRILKAQVQPWHPCWTVGIYESPDAPTPVQSSSDEAPAPKTAPVGASIKSKDKMVKDKKVKDMKVKKKDKKDKDKKTAGKFSKYAPSPELAENMDSVEFRDKVYSAMKQAEIERKESQGGKLGSMVSDNYLDGLTESSGPPPKKKYGISKSWPPKPVEKASPPKK